ncbi:MAG TPA: hypothetical protein VLW51_09685 [Solirubrobacteraceae bacterium]|nr:hypothetical protein [Solirubrobacteraceae bacterium]
MSTGSTTGLGFEHVLVRGRSIAAATAAHDLDPDRVLALGYANRANITVGPAAGWLSEHAPALGWR